MTEKLRFILRFKSILQEIVRRYISIFKKQREYFSCLKVTKMFSDLTVTKDITIEGNCEESYISSDNLVP